MPIPRDDPPPLPPPTTVDDAETAQAFWEENKAQDPSESAMFTTARDEQVTAPSRLMRTTSGEVEFEIVASPHAKISEEGRSEEQREDLRREHERLCELDRVARQQHHAAEAERDRVEEERRRRDAARPLHQGQRITNRKGRALVPPPTPPRVLTSAPGDAFSDVRAPPPPVRRVAPPTLPRTAKGDVAWHLHQALEAALRENDRLKGELGRYKAHYGELPRTGRRR